MLANNLSFDFFIADKYRIWRTVLLFSLFFTVNLVLFSTNFTGIKFPNDGVYYLNIAENLINHGLFQDTISVPINPAVTHQNGIVFCLVVLKLVFGKYCFVAYVVLISVLWFYALKKMYELARYLGISKTVSIILGFVMYTKPEILTSNLSLSNESIYLPLCYYAVSDFLIKLNGNNRDKNNALLYLFLVIGLFFRNQHITILFTLFFSAWMFKLDERKAVTIFSIMGGLLFFIYVGLTPHLINQNLVNESFVIGNRFSLEKISFVLRQFANIYMPGFFFVKYVVFNLLLGLVFFSLFLFGLWKICNQEKYKRLGILLILLIGSNSLFLFVLPFSDDRYSVVMHFYILLVQVSILTGFRKSIQKTIPVMFVIVTISLFALILFKYVNGTKGRVPVYGMLKQYEEYKTLPDIKNENIIYFSESPRMTYWMLEKSSCDLSPAECAEYFKYDEKTSDMVYFGSITKFNNRKQLAGYKVADCLISKCKNYGIWRIEKIPALK
jgi:hypothetical protein